MTTLEATRERTLPTFTDARREALLELLHTLAADGYHFVTVTPGSHARVVARSGREEARSLRDVLGWSLPFRPEVVPSAMLVLLRAAEVVSDRPGGRLGCDIRVSSVGDTLFLHSAYPTTEYDSVFLGPDSYRFADLIVAQMGSLHGGAHILDYGAGAGVGGITAARRQPGSTLTLADINPKALFLSSINAEFAGVDHRTVEATRPREVAGAFDLIVTHPPFMMDSDGRAYRDGGDLFGTRLSLDWVLDGVEKLAPGGRLVLHTGVSIVDGRDVLLEHLQREFRGAGWGFDYHELDPDIFSEDLAEPAYAEVDRIAAVGLCITREENGVASNTVSNTG
jgi:hypothetical protein